MFRFRDERAVLGGWSTEGSDIFLDLSKRSRCAGNGDLTREGSVVSAEDLDFSSGDILDSQVQEMPAESWSGRHPSLRRFLLSIWHHGGRLLEHFRHV